ncbi:MAG: DUF4290 domain-containing protein [Rikenellaceae bacterium]|jgi:hypothetical protein|nr:DUF4290 domain-containing protein [Rikenellaceae bacterium]
MNKNYNFERGKLNLPEYGRNILKMVNYLMSIRDRDLRNGQARVVVEVMGNINTHLRDTDDLKHKLWDHLFIISDFRLDVDSPYPKPSPDSVAPHPERLKYPDRKITFKHYGKNIETMIRNLPGLENEEDRQAIVANIAKYMRNKSHEYNLEYPNNETVINDIRQLSAGRIAVGDDILDHSKSDFRPSQPQRQQYKNGKNGKNGYHKQNAPGQNRKMQKNRG